MKAMLFEKVGQPAAAGRGAHARTGAGAGAAAGAGLRVCHTDLHILDGELASPSCRWCWVTRSSGRWSAVEGANWAASTRSAGGRALAGLAPTAPAATASAGRRTCASSAAFTGYTMDGGFAEYTLADERFCFPLPEGYPDLRSCPAAVRRADRLPHLPHGRDRMLKHWASTASARRRTSSPRWRNAKGRQVYAFTRPGDIDAQEFACSQGADWAGDSTQLPPGQAGRGADLCPGRRAGPGGAQAPPRAAVWSVSAAAST